MSRADKARATREAVEHAEMLELIQMPAFRKFLWHVFSVSSMFHSTHGANALTSAFAEGRRSLGLDILDRLRMVQPDVLLHVLRDSINTQQEPQNGTRSRYPSSADADDVDDDDA